MQEGRDTIMKKLVALLCGVAVVLALPARSSAQAQAIDVTGEWAMTVNTDNGQIPVTLVLKQEGEKVTGSIRSDMGESAIEGTMKEKTLSFAFNFSAPDGNSMVITMSGAVEGATIKGTFDAGGMMSGSWEATKK
jgi:hypothetical protein